MLQAEQSEPNEPKAEAVLELKAERALCRQWTQNVENHVYIQHFQLKYPNFAKLLPTETHHTLFVSRRHAMKGDSKMLEKIAALLLNILLFLFQLNTGKAVLFGCECPPCSSHWRKQLQVT